MRATDLAAAQAQTSAPASAPLVLEYTRAAQKWVEALPIGGGRLGAMVFGGVGTERLQLNDDTLWSGGPNDTGNPKAREVLPQVRRAVAAGQFVEADTLAKGLQGPYTQTYLPLGDLILSFEHGDIAADYRRTLDLRDAVATTRFRVGTIHYTREVIASHPARVIAMRLTADRPGSLRFAARLRSQLRLRPWTLTARRWSSAAGRRRTSTRATSRRTIRSAMPRMRGMRFEIRIGAVTRRRPARDDSRQPHDRERGRGDAGSLERYQLQRLRQVTGARRPRCRRARRPPICARRSANRGTTSAASTSPIIARSSTGSRSR